MRSAFFLVCVLAALPGCGNIDTSRLDIKELGKSDMGRFYELVVSEQLGATRLMMQRLYLRNPDELKKNGGGHTPESRVAQVFTNPPQWSLPELGGATSTEALSLAFSPHFSGDRVLAFSVGMGSMIMQSFNNYQEFYALDYVDAQKIYNSARNLEIARWQLNNKLRPDGQPFLLANELKTNDANLSFDRILTTMISQQDLVASMMMNKTGRTVNKTLQKMSTAIFLPI